MLDIEAGEEAKQVLLCFEFLSLLSASGNRAIGIQRTMNICTGGAQFIESTFNQHISNIYAWIYANVIR